MYPCLKDRIVSVFAYFTLGMFSIIWIIWANMTKKRISPFLNFNLYQAIFISIAYAVISLIYSIAVNFLSALPYIGDFMFKFNLFFNETPIYFSFSLSGIIALLILLYLCFCTLLGKIPYVPFISDTVNSNFEG